MGWPVGSLVELTFTLCLLVMFYAVESLRRERVTRIDAVYYASPMKTGALIVGKSVASSAVGFVRHFHRVFFGFGDSAERFLA